MEDPDIDDARLGRTQVLVLHLLARGENTVRGIVEACYGEAAEGTVRNSLKRLAARGLVASRPEGSHSVFALTDDGWQVERSHAGEHEPFTCR
jgi:DNA-binding PadR family transcriptional regulator